MAAFIQQSFGGGMNLGVDDTRLGTNEYGLAYNIRNRHDAVECVKKAKAFDTTNALGGYSATDPRVQGIIFVDPYFFIFVDGICLKKSKDSDTFTTVWTTSSSHTKPAAYSNGVTTGTGTIRLAETAEFVYTVVVPPSYDNFAGKAVSADNASAGGQTDYTKRIPPTVAGIVVQDGTNRPNLIEIAADATVTARQLMGYDQWRPNFVRINLEAGYDTGATTYTVDATPVQINSGAVIKFTGGGVLTVNDTNSAGDTALGGVLSVARVEDDELGIVGFREYVPIGKQMAFHGGKLYVASADGTKLYHSVSGRPLDFMVPVNEDGGKIHDAEAIGGVEAVAYTISNDPITCLKSLNTEELFVGAFNSSYSVKPDTVNTIFGEPTFTKKFLFSTGPVNQNAVVDLLGDTAFIDRHGIRSFNAVQQAETLARDIIFSLPISDVFKDVAQDGSFQCATVHDGYALFHVLTNLPEQYLTVVYDMATKKFVSLDRQESSKTGATWQDGAVATLDVFDANTFCTPIRAMATGVTTAGSKDLFAVTDDPSSKSLWVKHLYGSTEFAMGRMDTKAYSTQEPMVELKPISMNMMFNKPFEAYHTFKIDNSDGYTPGVYPSTATTELHSGSGTSLYITVDVFKEGDTAVTTDNLPIHNTTLFFDSGATLVYKEFATSGSVGRSLSNSATKVAGILSNAAVSDNDEGRNAGYVAVSQFVDDVRTDATHGGLQARGLPLIQSGLRYPVVFPAEYDVNTHANLAFNWQASCQGWKIKYRVYLQGSSKLSQIRLEAKDVTLKSSLINQAYSA
tara:strand:+ start:516 stop:2903 length:2388 start_codon:yes stop_codon:yes gene_type:complete